MTIIPWVGHLRSFF